jgi:hypothetical protein
MIIIISAVLALISGVFMARLYYDDMVLRDSGRSTRFAAFIISTFTGLGCGIIVYIAMVAILLFLMDLFGG